MLAITLVTVLVIPRHNFMVAATTDTFRTSERTECRGEASIRTLSNDMLGDGLSSSRSRRHHSRCSLRT